jgi:hypothetical protein
MQVYLIYMTPIRETMHRVFDSYAAAKLYAERFGNDTWQIDAVELTDVEQVERMN